MRGPRRIFSDLEFKNVGKKRTSFTIKNIVPTPKDVRFRFPRFFLCIFLLAIVHRYTKFFGKRGTQHEQEQFFTVSKSGSAAVPAHPLSSLGSSSSPSSSPPSDVSPLPEGSNGAAPSDNSGRAPGSSSLTTTVAPAVIISVVPTSSAASASPTFSRTAGAPATARPGSSSRSSSSCTAASTDAGAAASNIACWDLFAGRWAPTSALPTGPGREDVRLYDKLPCSWLPQYCTSKFYWGKCSGENFWRWEPLWRGGSSGVGTGDSGKDENKNYNQLNLLDSTWKGLFCKKFDGKTFLFVGDSITGQLFTSFAHVLGVKKRAVLDGPYCGEAVHEIALQAELCTGEDGDSAITSSSTVRALFVRNEFLWRPGQERTRRAEKSAGGGCVEIDRSEDYAVGLGWGLGWRDLWTGSSGKEDSKRPADVLVLNTGRHPRAMDTFQKQIDSLMEWLDGEGATPSISNKAGTVSTKPTSTPRGRDIVFLSTKIDRGDDGVPDGDEDYSAVKKKVLNPQQALMKKAALLATKGAAAFQEEETKSSKTGGGPLPRPTLPPRDVCWRGRGGSSDVPVQFGAEASGFSSTPSGGTTTSISSTKRTIQLSSRYNITDIVPQSAWLRRKIGLLNQSSDHQHLQNRYSYVDYECMDLSRGMVGFGIRRDDEGVLKKDPAHSCMPGPIDQKVMVFLLHMLDEERGR